MTSAKASYLPVVCIALSLLGVLFPLLVIPAIITGVVAIRKAKYRNSNIRLAYAGIILSNAVILLTIFGFVLFVYFKTYPLERIFTPKSDSLKSGSILKNYGRAWSTYVFTNKRQPDSVDALYSEGFLSLEEISDFKTYNRGYTIIPIASFNSEHYSPCMVIAIEKPGDPYGAVAGYVLFSSGSVKGIEISGELYSKLYMAVSNNDYNLAGDILPRCDP